MNDRYLASRELIVEPTPRDIEEVDSLINSSIAAASNIEELHAVVRILSEKPANDLPAAQKQLLREKQKFFMSEMIKLVHVTGTVNGSVWVDTDPANLEELLAVFPQVSKNLVVSEDYGLRTHLKQLLLQLLYEKNNKVVDITLP